MADKFGLQPFQARSIEADSAALEAVLVLENGIALTIVGCEILTEAAANPSPDPPSGDEMAIPAAQVRSESG